MIHHIKTIILGLLICLLAGLLSCSYPTAQIKSLEQQAGNFVHIVAEGNKTVRVWYYRPQSFDHDSPVVFVMHGKDRNGRDYRDDWIPYAEEKGVLLLAPEFSQWDYPGSSGYNLGNMFTVTGEKNSKALWSFTAVEEIFDFVRTITHSRVEQYSIYGHSAGAQFVHRLLMFCPEARVKKAIAANAGWYTTPTDDNLYPYGLKGSGVADSCTSSAFRRRLTILLGADDTNPFHNGLRKTREAMAQGIHRLARGCSFYETARKESVEQQVPLLWQLQIIPGVGHSNSAMASYAAKLLD
jgi:poly(3-hydroxybutyrate) depolymerase